MWRWAVPVPKPQPRPLITPKSLAQGKIAPKLVATPGTDPGWAEESAAEADNPEGIEVLLVHRPQYHDWSWPKGKLELGEHLISAAVREVEEETGVAVNLHAPMLTQRYRLGIGITKEVYYWVGTVAEDDAKLAARPVVQQAPAAEIDKTAWVSPAKARRMLTRRGDRRLLDDLLAKAQAQLLATFPLILVAPAETIPARNDHDLGLSLSRGGVTQSLEILKLLSAYGVSSLWSAPCPSAQQTLRPFADVAGLQIRPLDDPRRLLHELIVQAGETISPSSPQTRNLGYNPNPAGAMPSHAAAICIAPQTLSEWVKVLQNSVALLPGQATEVIATSMESGEAMVLHLRRPQQGELPGLVAMERHRVTI
ncbi:hypothetical protein BM477_05320 [Boudabousia marimammalium]|uniref:Nudix hydrolase domain-containing protein n=1 Tax=Boudabousia marimammalium TaxID=156892 RepID=A0A1Q5PM64_9ACTO|nr:hypothetical protein BM477_05320 [Boudabousia marimammalium]